MSGALNHSPADVIRRLLVSLSCGTDPSDNGAWPIYVANEPSTPDNCITVQDVVGRLGGRHMTDGTVLEHYGFQVRVRATGHNVGFTRAQLIATALDKTISYDSILVSQPTTITASTYLVFAVSRTGQILAIGREQGTNRSLFTIDAVVALRQTNP